jgi:hypothetical protein
LKAALLCGRECFVYVDKLGELDFVQAYAEMLCRKVPVIASHTGRQLLVQAPTAPLQIEAPPLDMNKANKQPECLPVVEPQYVRCLEDQLVGGEVIPSYNLDSMAPPPLPLSPPRYGIEVPPLPKMSGNISQFQLNTLLTPVGYTGSTGNEADIEDGEVRTVDNLPINSIVEDLLESLDDPEQDGSDQEGTPDKAGASAFSKSSQFYSGNDKLVFTSASTGSPIVLPLSKNPGKPIGRTGYTYQDSHILYYEWKTGPDKGKRVAVDQAQKFLINKTPYSLKPVWASPNWVEQRPALTNTEIQSTLGDMFIDEYGSLFGNPS